jgi:type IV secretory pathway VirD2 relaxase
VRLGGDGLAKARAHLRYIQRDGADRNRAPGRLYGPERDAVDGAAFLEDGKDDRHQFRIIISPEEAGDLADLDGFTRDVMAAAERDLETKLDWVAVNHFDSDHPHVHVVLRGRAEDGSDLVIARSYITHGLRARAEEIATLELGPRRDLDIAQARRAEADRERFTSLDRELTGLAQDGVVTLPESRTAYDRFQAKVLRLRLRALEKMNLARRERNGWRLSPDLEATLRAAGRRGDIIRSMHHVMGDALAPATVREFGDEAAPARLIGRVAGSGAVDDAQDWRFLAVDGADGNQWRVEISMAPGAAPPKGAIVEISRRAAEPKHADRVITAIASRHDGLYSDALHEAADPKASAEYRLTHQRRLEALRRAGIAERDADGSWRIPANFLERAAAFEAEKSGVRLRVLSWVALGDLPAAQARVFLDDAHEGRLKLEAVRAGFGEELTDALTARRRWLLANGLAREDGGRLAIDREALAALERASVDATATKLVKELGKEFAPPISGGRVEGVYRRPIDLPSGRFAVVEKAKQFTLVPWREVLEKRRGMEVAGLVERAGVSWTFGKNRGGPMR